MDSIESLLLLLGINKKMVALNNAVEKTRIFNFFIIPYCFSKMSFPIKTKLMINQKRTKRILK